MHDHEIIRSIRLNWRLILPGLLRPAKAKVNGEVSYVCPFCSHGEHGDGLTFDPGRQGRLHCFGPCGWSGDVIDLYRAMYSCSFEEAISSLREMIGAPSMLSTITAPEQLREPPADIEEFIAASKRSFVDSPADRYLNNRGISTRTALECGVGYCKDWRHPRAPLTVASSPRLIIPTSSESYLARDIRALETLTLQERKYTKQKVGHVCLYCSKEVQSTIQPVFIVEGELDALSLMEIGKEVIALGSVSCVNLFLRTIADGPKPRHPFIVALDNDSAGVQASTQLIEALRDQGFIVIDGREILGQYKDVNDTLVFDRSQLMVRTDIIEQRAVRLFQFSDHTRECDKHSHLQILSTSEYLQKGYSKDISYFSAFNKRKTGFENIDDVTSFYPGLYALGGISSLGKTTFVHQLADQLAATGEHVLYFPIEQSPMELVSKGISRIMYSENPRTAVTSIRLRSGYMSEAVSVAQEKYRQRSNTLSIAECGFTTTAADIKNAVYDYAYRTGTAPVVIVDYLQALQPSSNDFLGQREAVDLSLRIFKDMQMDLSATVIVVSSLNRANYLTPIGFESFKESGGIEYTCDVVWGIDLMCMNDHIFDTQGHMQTKREIVNAAKASDPRKVRLVCLKNRFGISSYNVSFDYFPGFDTFVPLRDSTSKPDFLGDRSHHDELLFSSEDQDALTRVFLDE